MTSTPSSHAVAYGVHDASFRAAGCEEGIQTLVEDFYSRMNSLPDARVIREMHPDDLAVSIDKLARFLCGWLGGPKRYHEKYGSISIPGVHGHLAIAANERDEWLKCMQLAVEAQPFADDFKKYLLEQLAVPAEHIRRACARERRN